MSLLCAYVAWSTKFTLGVYGDVVRVKILYNKRDSALIQFKEPQQIHTGKLRKSCMKPWLQT